MARFCIYCRIVYEENVPKCLKCNGTDFRYINSEQFESYNGEKIRIQNK